MRLQSSVRDGSVDIVRSVGIIAIVAGHVWGGSLVTTIVYPWHVPLFFFLSGWLWKERTLVEEIHSRAKTLIRPYLFWLFALLGILVASQARNGAIDFMSFAETIYGGAYATRPFTTFWFVSTLFVTVVLYRLVQRLPAWLLALIVSGGVIMGITIGSWLAHTPLAIASALPALVFVVIGHICRCLSTHRWAGALLGMVLLVSSAGLVASGISRPLNLKIGDWGTPVISITVAIAISWGMLLIARAYTDRLPSKVGSVATWFAVAGFTIILMHPAMLWGLRIDTTDGNIGVFAAALLVPLAVGRIAIRTPLSPWMTGIPATNQTRLTREIGA